MYDIEQHLKVRTPQACLWVRQRNFLTKELLENEINILRGKEV